MKGANNTGNSTTMYNLSFYILYTMEELPNQNNSIGYFLSTEQTTTIVLAHSQGRKKGTKTDNKEICLLS